MLRLVAIPLLVLAFVASIEYAAMGRRAPYFFFGLVALQAVALAIVIAPRMSRSWFGAFAKRSACFGALVAVALYILSLIVYARVPVGQEHAVAIGDGTFFWIQDSSGRELGARIEWRPTVEVFGQRGAGGTSVGNLFVHWRSERPLVRLVVALAVPALILSLVRPRPHPAGSCAACGYDLTGNVSGRCSECGATFAPEPDGTASEAKRPEGSKDEDA